MGKAYSSLFRRSARNWNVENRAHKVVEKMETGKPKPAPLHESTRTSLENFRKENPELLEDLRKKHPGLDQRLQGMVVEPEKMGQIRTVRHLPEDKRTPQDFEYGYMEPDAIPEGRCSIRQVLDYLSKHQTSPFDYSAESISKEYKMDKAHVQNILHYYQMLHIQFPKDSKGRGYLEDQKARPLPPKFMSRISLSGKKDDSQMKINPQDVDAKSS